MGVIARNVVQRPVATEPSPAPPRRRDQRPTQKLHADELCDLLAPEPREPPVELEELEEIEVVRDVGEAPALSSTRLAHTLRRPEPRSDPASSEASSEAASSEAASSEAASSEHAAITQRVPVMAGAEAGGASWSRAVWLGIGVACVGAAVTLLVTL